VDGLDDLHRARQVTAHDNEMNRRVTFEVEA